MTPEEREYIVSLHVENRQDWAPFRCRRCRMVWPCDVARIESREAVRPAVHVPSDRIPEIDPRDGGRNDR